MSATIDDPLPLCRNAADVVASISFAHEQGLTIAVRSGGNDRVNFV